MSNCLTDSSRAASTVRFLAGLVLGVVLLSCATPAERAERLAAASGFEKRVVMGDPFRHLVFIRNSSRPVDGFRIYLEGDGTPWITRRLVAYDPTPRRPLMLELMRLDPGPALYLGRPCYFDIMLNCRSEYWTGKRYSETVVASMVTALHNIREQLEWRGDVTLLGHSGGGTLAMLMAPRVARTKTVVTLAANLDVDGWTRMHRYSPLSGSLNPATAAPLPAHIRQLHVVGGRDRNVPPRITRAGAERQSNAEVLRYPQHNHHCCWEKEWQSILDRL